MKKTCSIIIALALSLTVVLGCVITASAAYTYGYKEDETYSFNLQMSSTATTSQGTGGMSVGGSVTYKIKDITEGASGYRVKVTCTVVTSMSGSGGESMVQEQVLEGDPKPFIRSSSLGPVTPFITTDWATRDDEWKAYVDALDEEYGSGSTIKDSTQSSGTFTVNVEYDVSDAQSNIDFDSDGNNDKFEGTLSIRLQYDSNGVLQSYSSQMNRQFNPSNSYAETIEAGTGAPALALNNMVLYVIIGVVSFIVALAIGFMIGRMRPMRSRETYSTGGSSAESPSIKAFGTYAQK
jgi:hypothetical protein